MGIKGGDNHAFTVCDNLHREIHANGNEQEVLERHGIDFDILEYCDEQYRKYKQNSV